MGESHFIRQTSRRESSAKTAYEAIPDSPICNGIPLSKSKKCFLCGFAVRDLSKIIGPLPKRMEYADIREIKPDR